MKDRADISVTMALMLALLVTNACTPVSNAAPLGGSLGPWGGPVQELGKVCAADPETGLCGLD